MAARRVFQEDIFTELGNRVWTWLALENLQDENHQPDTKGRLLMFGAFIGDQQCSDLVAAPSGRPITQFNPPTEEAA